MDELALARPFVVRSLTAEHTNSVPSIDFSDAEHAAVTAAVHRTIADDRYALSPRLAPLKSALANLDPASAPKPRPAPKPLPETPVRTRGGGHIRR